MPSLTLNTDGIYITLDTYQKFKVFNRLTKREQFSLSSWWFDIFRDIYTVDLSTYIEGKLREVQDNYAIMVQRVGDSDDYDQERKNDFFIGLNRELKEVERSLEPLHYHEKKLVQKYLDSDFTFLGRNTTASGIYRTLTMAKKIDKEEEGKGSLILITIGAVGLKDKMMITVSETFILDYDEVRAVGNAIDKAYKKEEI